MDSTGYRQAVIHIAWFRDDQIYHLLFGMVELRPTEFPDAAGSPLHSHRAKSRSRKYLHYRRFVMPAKDAIEWYKSATRSSSITLPSDPNRQTMCDGAQLTSDSFIQEPSWPQFITANELTIAPDWMNGSRIHFLFRQKTMPAEVSVILQVDKNRSKLEDWLNFDIVDAYHEYQGALCIVAPNPLFRSIQRSHISGSDTDSPETVAYKVVARQGQALNGLRLEINNERVGGPLTPVVHKIDEDPITEFQFPTRIYKEGISVTHPEYGLVYWRRPAPLIRSIRTRVELIRGRKRVEVPAAGRRRPAQRYEVNEVGDTTDSVIGEASPDLIYRIANAESRRSRAQLAKDYDQEWFYRSPQEAAQYIRDRIGNARDSVLIVDPYFAGRELLSFGHAIRRSKVHLRVLSSTSGLKESCLGTTAVESALQLQEIRDTTFNDYSSLPEIRIVGDPPAVHDRFLVIDGRVWLSGNSLNMIGERAGMIVRLPDPETVIARLEGIWSQARPLSDWLAAPTGAEARPPGDGQAV